MCGMVKAGKVGIKAVSHFIQSNSVNVVHDDVEMFDRLESKVDRLWSIE